MNDDDDLPVLTQVLRTGVRIGPDTADLDAAGFPAAPAELPAAHTIPDQLVIGNESWTDPRPVSPSPPIVAAPVDDARPDAPWLDHAPDSFSLPQDLDAGGGPRTIGTLGEPEMPMQDAPSMLDDVTFDVPHPATPVPTGADRAELEARLREAILDDLRARIDTELDARIAQLIHAEVETALAQLQGKLRSHLSQALRDVVARAVEGEMVRMTMIERSGASPP